VTIINIVLPVVFCSWAFRTVAALAIALRNASYDFREHVTLEGTVTSWLCQIPIASKVRL